MKSFIKGFLVGCAAVLFLMFMIYAVLWAAKSFGEEVASLVFICLFAGTVSGILFWGAEL